MGNMFATPNDNFSNQEIEQLRSKIQDVTQELKKLSGIELTQKFAGIAEDVTQLKQVLELPEEQY